MEFKDYLKILAGHDGSDLYLTTDAPPAAKFQGNLTPIEKVKLTREKIKEIAYSLMDDDQKKVFEKQPELN